MNPTTKELELMVKDLFRLVANNNWATPEHPENVKWFKEHGVGLNKPHEHPSLLAKRLEELALAGADLSSKASVIANINVPEVLAVGLKYGANPNLRGRSPMIPIERALNRGRGRIEKLLLENPNFDFNARSSSNKNILFTAVENGRHEAIKFIFQKHPEFALEKDDNENNILLAVALFLKKGKKLNKKVLSFVINCLDYANSKNYQFSVNEANKFNQTILSTHPELAQLIVERYMLDLKSKLDTKEVPIKKNISKI